MMQILHSIGLPPPMIIFCNQKKTADMVCRDVQRAGVSPPSSLFTAPSPSGFAWVG
jgi:hypothetical protein